MDKKSLLSLWSNDVTSIIGVNPTPILRRLARDTDAIVAVASWLRHPHINHYRESPLVDLEHHLHVHANHWSDVHPGKNKPHALNAVLFAILEADMPESKRCEILGGVAAEEDLTEPVKKALLKEGWRVETEVPIASSRADLVAFGRPRIERLIVAIELKNNHAACGRLDDQIRDYGTAADEVRVVMTPYCLLECALREDALCDPRRVTARIEKNRASLVVYDATDNVFETAHTVTSSYEGKKWDELWGKLNTPAAKAA